MPYYYFLFSVIALILSLLSLRLVIWGKKNIPLLLFAEARRDENRGCYEQALLTYEIALNKIENIRFGSTLKNKILGKIKLLHNLIEYRNNFYSPLHVAHIAMGPAYPPHAVSMINLRQDFAKS